MQHVGRVYVFETAQNLIQEIADVIVTQSLREKKKKKTTKWIKVAIRMKIYVAFKSNA